VALRAWGWHGGSIFCLESSPSGASGGGALGSGNCNGTVAFRRSGGDSDLHENAEGEVGITVDKEDLRGSNGGVGVPVSPSTMGK
jgi:hypothetical protein